MSILSAYIIVIYAEKRISYSLYKGDDCTVIVSYVTSSDYEISILQTIKF